MFRNLFSATKTLSTLGLCSFIGLISVVTGSIVNTERVSASPGFFEYQWDQDSNYRRLKYLQSADGRLERSNYFLFLKPKDRKKNIIKLSIKVPDYFDSKLTPKKFSLCKVKVGGYTSRTKCLKNIPALFEINKDQTNINIFPEIPIPLSKDTYAISMKIFNPRKRGMFQFQAFSNSPGDVPISSYVGTWNINIQ